MNKKNVLTIPFHNVTLMEWLEISGGRGLYWTILMGEFVTDPDAEFYYERVRNSIDEIFGLPVEWSDLIRIVEDIQQIYTFLIIGCKTNERKRYNTFSFERLCKESEVIIDAPDGPYWEVYIKDTEFCESIYLNLSREGKVDGATF